MGSKQASLSIVLLSLSLPLFLMCQWSNDPYSPLQISTWGLNPASCSSGDGGVYIGWMSFSYENSNVYLQRLDDYGYIQWESPLFIENIKVFQSQKIELLEDGSGGVYLGYNVHTPVDTIENIIIYNGTVTLQHVDSSGNKLWGDGIILGPDSSNHSRRFKLVTDNSDGLIVGWIDLVNDSYDAPNDLWLQRIDPYGTGLWGDNGYVLVDSISGIFDIVADVDQGAFVRWWAWPFVTDTANWFCKVNGQGNVLWTNVIPSPWLEPNWITITPYIYEGLLIIATNTETWPLVQIKVYNISNAGNWIWGENGIVIADSLEPFFYRHFNASLQSDSTSIIFWSDKQSTGFMFEAKIQKVTYTGDVLYNDGGISPSLVESSRSGAAGIIESFDESNIYIFSATRDSIANVYAQRLNEDGVPLWDSNDILFSNGGGLVSISDGRGGAIMIWDEAPVDGIFAQQISRNGNLGEVLPPLHTLPNTSIPENFQLLQNYPNPFNSKTNIPFILQNRGVVKLAIYNLLGKEIITLLNEDKTPGEYSVYWNGLNSYDIEVGSGVYLCLLEISSYKQTTKIVLLK